MEFTKEEKQALQDKMVAFRRERHKHPENGWTEFFATSAVIKELQKLGAREGVQLAEAEGVGFAVDGKGYVFMDGSHEQLLMVSAP